MKMEEGKDDEIKDEFDSKFDVSIPYCYYSHFWEIYGANTRVCLIKFK
jgi:hypothetical protein